MNDTYDHICGLYKFSDYPSQNHTEITTEVNNVGRCIIIYI